MTSQVVYLLLFFLIEINCLVKFISKVDLGVCVSYQEGKLRTSCYCPSSTSNLTDVRKGIVHVSECGASTNKWCKLWKYLRRLKASGFLLKWKKWQPGATREGLGGGSRYTITSLSQIAQAGSHGLQGNSSAVASCTSDTAMQTLAGTKFPGP